MSDDGKTYDQSERWNDLEESGRVAQDAHRSDIWTSMVAIVKSHDREKNTVTVQPALKQRRVKSDGSAEWVQMPHLSDVPIMYPGGGGATWSFPMKEGDEVLVSFVSRNIDKWWQQGGVQEQNAPFRMHDMSDGFAIPGFRSQPRKLANVSEHTAQLRTDDGSMIIDFDPDSKKITITSPNAVKIVGDLDVTGEIRAKCDTAPVKSSTHHHSGVQAGGSQTNAPVPGT